MKERIAPENIEFFTSGKGKGAEILRHFNERLTTVVASGLPANLARPLKHLNKIRNEFAHNLDYEIKDADMTKYFELVDAFTIDVGTPNGFEDSVKDF